MKIIYYIRGEKVKNISRLKDLDSFEGEESIMSYQYIFRVLSSVHVLSCVAEHRVSCKFALMNS